MFQTRRITQLLLDCNEQRRFKQPPIIIGGCGRSGTTLLLAVLGAHPRIFSIPYETGVFCPGAYETMEPERNIDFDFRRIQKQLLRANPFKSFDRWCEKTPKNVVFFGRILSYFKNRVRLLHIVRDGRDVVTSQHPTRRNAYWVSIDRWVHDVSCGLEFSEHPSVYTLKYEDLVLQSEETIRKLCDFLDLEFVAGMRNFHKHTNVNSSLAWHEEVTAFHADSIGKWRTGLHQEVLEAFLADGRACALMRSLGYLP